MVNLTGTFEITCMLPLETSSTVNLSLSVGGRILSVRPELHSIVYDGFGKVIMPLTSRRFLPSFSWYLSSHACHFSLLITAQLSSRITTLLMLGSDSSLISAVFEHPLNSETKATKHAVAFNERMLICNLRVLSIFAFESSVLTQPESQYE